MSMIQDADLADVMMSASSDDIGLLIDVITDSGKGRISLSSSVCRQLSAAKEREITDLDRGLVVEELTRFGGNSLMNVFRGGSGVPYKELLTDVASHVGVAKSGLGDCASMEMAIIAKVVEQSVGRMSEDDKKTFFESVGAGYRPGMGPTALASLIASLSASGLTSYRLAAVVASATMSSLVGRGVMLAGSAGLGRGLAVLAGPVGWAITGLWTAFDLASPAYRVTVPCVIQIGHMRQKMLVAKMCPACGTAVEASSRFCGHCGVRLGERGLA
ncbi:MULTISPECIES: zinc-ribbon domain-containing protein [Pseudomonas]|jgi:uncharacterized protein YaaW (UPF0174 family)|uniref:Uncharacterized protein YaaW (UPF0174 family) n=1 Tax=Pseudomonas putida TaxID=303 RepID=A0A9X8EQM9_PSEPU|nr:MULTISPECIES: zinc-ribbon domain-containing protein [Pseudomonas]KIU52192.1 hypothetical protein QV12_09935 [Pseudomonas putida]MBG8562395.1 hypothetical protein [Pseudomonas qingdaonensis]MCP8347410.1 hypothetical protein [Pseudomonas sp. FBF18]OOW02982.1 hypothetical protein MF6396_11270 [Pseudomonas sp. MF6396]ROQ53486.1 uncharacterized protein YaaW (UPF0174 family) [Pseudomonas putida]